MKLRINENHDEQIRKGVINSMDQKLISIKEMAKKLNVPVSWLYSRTRTNDIPHYKLGKYVRFSESEIFEWLKERSQEE